MADQRIKLINQILIGIKAIKYFSYERPLAARVHALRDKEVDVLKLIQVCELVADWHEARVGG